MWNGKKKAVTFSYDDGIVFDKQLVEILNKYGLKCTFNLNSGVMSWANSWVNTGVEIHRMNAKDLPKLYEGHEIAVHCLTHADLTKCDDDTVRNEIMLDKDNLERIFNCKIEGMTYPFGTYNDRVVEILKECKIKYARTTETTEGASKPENLLRLKSACHHKDLRVMDIIKEFINLDENEINEPQMLYIWGHSYEFEIDNNWDLFEEICSTLAGRDDIFYGTNSQVLSPFYGQ